MARLLIHVEGQTEESFVNELLRPHLLDAGYHHVSPRLLGKRGGIPSWASARKDISDHLKADSTSFATTMVDYYALPASKDRAWPGRSEANRLSYPDKAPHVERAIFDDLAAVLGKRFDSRRFVPFVIMHEFESLLFSDCALFAKGINQPKLASRFQAIRDEFDSPEEINDSPDTHPAQRVEDIEPRYTKNKPLYGVLAALEIGLARIRAECPHFNAWLMKLEGLTR